MKTLDSLLFNDDLDLINPSLLIFGKEKISYRELFKQASCVLTDLEEDLQGKVCAVKVSSALDFVLILLALIKAKAVVYPIGPELTDYNVESQLKTLKPDYLISEETNLSDYRFSSTLKSLSNKLSLMKRSKQEKDLPSIFKDGGFIRFTSGTTGQAKGVFISFNSAYERVLAVKEHIPLSSTDVVLNLMPLAYHFIVSVLHFISERATIMIPRAMTVNMLFELENLKQTSVIYAAPFHYDILSKLEVTTFGENLRIAISTGTKLTKSTFETFHNKYSIGILEAYGLIEIGLPILNFNLSSDFVPGLIGDAKAPYKTKIFSDKEVETNEMGLLAIKGPGMFDAYLNPFNLRDNVLKQGWFITTDLAKIDAEGNITLLGRESSVIHVLGHKVFPEEIEEIVISLGDVMECQVYSREDAVFGSLVGIKVIKESSSDLSEEDIRAFCRRHLEKYKVPREIEFVKELKKTRTGKLIRKKSGQSW